MNFIEILPQLLINLQSLYKKKLRLSGLTFPQLIGLYMIPYDGIEISILSKKIGSDISTLSRLINGLENKKLVKRIKSDIDKRVIQVLLTPKGKSLREKLEQKLDEIGCLIEKNIDPKSIKIKEEMLLNLNWEVSKVLLNN